MSSKITRPAQSGQSVSAWPSKFIQDFISTQRWFRSKEKKIIQTELEDSARIELASGQTYLLALIRVHYSDHTSETYFVPFAGTAKNLFLHEGFSDLEFEKWFIQNVGKKAVFRSGKGRFVFEELSDAGAFQGLETVDIKNLKVEQSNTSVIIKSKWILKAFRKIEEGISPEVEMLGFLNTVGFANVPKIQAHIIYERSHGQISTAGLIQNFIPNDGDGWKFTLHFLDRFYRDFIFDPETNLRILEDRCANYLSGFVRNMFRLGELTGGMHAALASDPDSEYFSPEAIELKDVEKWSENYCALLETVLRALRKKQQKHEILDSEGILKNHVRVLNLLREKEMSKIRFHGDFHLGQVLKGPEDWVLFDFEGEPLRSLEERKRKTCPLKDAAGMLRSFNYAAHVSAADWIKKKGVSKIQVDLLRSFWEGSVRRAFLKGYFDAAWDSDVPFVSEDLEINLKLISFFEMEKAVYELNYELNNRPDWMFIPVRGLLALISQASRENAAL